MEQQKLFVVVALLVLFLCAAGSGQAVRLLHDVDVDREFGFGTKAAAETEPLDPALDDDDYESEISRVEFEPKLGSTAPHTVAAAPHPAATVTVSSSSGPAPGPIKARNAAAGGRSMKWWLPPSTMPSFPLFPNPGGMPGIPGFPMPGMPFHPIGGWGAPAPPAHAQPSPPASGSGSGGNSNGNGNDPNTNGRTN
ncbi:hypothetical protein QOZ80_3AG0213680 [Eleusine coracana subsp. coracana]|nr:hypothetical protein QOZ80_3AG0213680 [Eleusine coracana subsp. coracana]